jgi:hypothetical protein
MAFCRPAKVLSADIWKPGFSWQQALVLQYHSSMFNPRLQLSYRRALR